MNSGTTQTVFVGLSGGVDSSVAALRLQRAGYNVVGVFIKVWHPDFLECDWERERLDAMRVAARLDIPFLTCDAVDAYKQGVADRFIAEYTAGRTPNPDVLCNQQVKFGAFLSFARGHEADFIATGHYAQLSKLQGSDSCVLLRGVDTEKDQSYFLWTLTQKELSHVLLPVGNSTKDAIRREAARAGLPTAAKKDSQGICFLGHINIPEFLSHYVDLEEGNVLDEAGTVIGRHQGALVYTLGQRHGFTLTDENAARGPRYVVSKDLAANTLTVAPAPPKTDRTSSIALTECNWIGELPQEGKQCTAQFRYRQTPFPITISNISNGTCTVTPAEQVDRPAPGQSCVLYDDNVCLGGGVIA